MSSSSSLITVVGMVSALAMAGWIMDMKASKEVAGSEVMTHTAFFMGEASLCGGPSARIAILLAMYTDKSARIDKFSSLGG